MTLKGLERKLKEIDHVKVMAESVTEDIPYLKQINLQQMYAGLDRDGIDLKPGYLEDPFFKTRAAAQRYSDWKDKITPSSKRHKGTPNLYINGYYYSSRDAEVQGEKIIYTSTYLENEIESKYGEEINGLGGIYKEEFLKFHLMPTFIDKMKLITGLK